MSREVSTTTYRFPTSASDPRTIIDMEVLGQGQVDSRVLPRPKGPLKKTVSLGEDSEPHSGIPPPPPIRIQKSALKGHSRSSSHGGVMSRTPLALESAPLPATALPSAMKKGHIRAASHGQIVEETQIKGHNRTQSKTDFILPPGHAERPRQPSGQFEKGHSRQASRSESVYTLRVDKKPKRNWCFWKRATATEEARIRRIVPNHMINHEPQHPNARFPTNQIRTTKYTAISFLPKNLFEQFHRFANLYFISIVLLNWIPAISAFGKEIAMLPVMFVLGVTAIKDLFEDRRRHKSDQRINNSFCRVYNKEQGRYIKVKWKSMRVGDIVHLSCNEMIPADILILRTSEPNGLCYIETMNLDGETNLKQREVVRDQLDTQGTFHPLHYRSEIHVGPPTTKIYHFTGYVTDPSLPLVDARKTPITKENLLLRDCILKNTDFIEGIVIYAGRETKAMLNNGGPRHKRTGLEKMMNLEVMWCVVILAVMCIVGATGSSLWFVAFTDPSIPFAIHVKDPNDPNANINAVYEAFLSFLTFIIILQIMIPLSLYVTIELIKLMQIYHIQADEEMYDEETKKGIECRAMNIPEDLGQIQYVFSDKTGTLTENKMLFRRCTIGARDYNHAPYILQEINRSSQLPLLTVNSTLSDLLSLVSVDTRRPVAAELRGQARRVHDFFLTLAVCNTVVVAKYPHHDKMNASGLIEDAYQTLDTSQLSAIRESPSPFPEVRTCRSGEEAEAVKSFQPLQQRPRPQRPGKLELPSSTRPLSPISDSRETTPTHSPALKYPRIPGLSGFKKTLNISPSSTSLSPAPSPAELRPNYEAESPDELALVEAAYAYKCKLLHRTPKEVKVAMPGLGVLEFQIMHTFPFDSDRKRMSIVLRDPTGTGVLLLCKGADSSLLPNLKPTHLSWDVELIEETLRNVNNYAREGLRILVMAKRHLTWSEYEDWLQKYQAAENDMHRRDQLMVECYSMLERNLELVGATGIEDRLQERVPEVIESLRRAGMVVWVLTGDKQETALNIAYSCRLFTATMDILKINVKSKSAASDTIKFYLNQIDLLQGIVPTDPLLPTSLSSVTIRNGSERALVVDGTSLTYILDQRNSNLLQPFLQLCKSCSAVLCCRATPLQKAFIVSSVKEQLGMRTLAIGDGANDVSMIQRADVGIGISGKEGMQAVMASDFAISKFKYLERLLLVHGHWCYDRLARMILYFFYKNAAFVFVIFWYQLYNGWSGSVMIDQMYLMVFNLIFTALPPMAMGIYDQDAKDSMLLAQPHLYGEGRRGKTHTGRSFWLNMVDALFASVVIFFMAYGAYQDSDVGMIDFGTTVTVTCMFTMLGNMVIETKYWTIVHVISVVGSIIFFYAFALIYNSLCMNLLGIQTPCQVVQMLMKRPTHWLIMFITVVVAVLPRVIIRVVESVIKPTDVHKALVAQRSRQECPDKQFFVSWSRSSSRSSVLKDKPPQFCWKNQKVQSKGIGAQEVPMVTT